MKWTTSWNGSTAQSRGCARSHPCIPRRATVPDYPRGERYKGGTMIHVTDKAAEQIKTIMQKENLLDHGLRVAVIGGGCSGMSYKLAFEKEPAREDKVYEEKGVRIFVDGKSYLLDRKSTRLNSSHSQISYAVFCLKK